MYRRKETFTERNARAHVSEIQSTIRFSSETLLIFIPMTVVIFFLASANNFREIDRLFYFSLLIQQDRIEPRGAGVSSLIAVAARVGL